MEFARKHKGRVGPRSLLAWDAGRLVTIAGWGYIAQLLSEDEAWSYILPMAQAVQRSYASWDELGKHYLLGFEFWSGAWDGKVARAQLAMFDNPASPWRTLPWGLDLGQHGLTVPMQPIVLEGAASSPRPSSRPAADEEKQHRALRRNRRGGPRPRGDRRLLCPRRLQQEHPRRPRRGPICDDADRDRHRDHPRRRADPPPATWDYPPRRTQIPPLAHRTALPRRQRPRRRRKKSH